MNFLEPDSQSFIVKVWVEERAGKAGRGVWYGHITHVRSHERRYLKDLDEIPAFIAPYLEAMGVEPVRRWRLRPWLKRLMECG
jgi:hypothetical protein